MPKPADSEARLGIIAGSGSLPLRLAEAAAGMARPPFIVAIGREADAATLRNRDHAHVELGAVGKLVDVLREAGCTQVVMAGKIRRPNFHELRPDWRGLKLLPRVVAAARKGDDALLSTLIAYLEEEGFRVIGADQVLADLVAAEGPVGRITPSEADMADLARAVSVALALGRLDVGQAAVVRDGIVLGVEAAEGTDALLQRCGSLQPEGRGGVLAKLPKPGQERRVDLPTIGVATVQMAAAARLNGIAVEAGGALILDRDEVAAAADASGLFVVGIPKPAES
ncbi:MAG TPA: UDP-2,3-diacylglucosamine diphosphatase LpxI [Candidatus Cybelea sp.]|nr:UDP-2,3-diacylglucosamine diphosphatase LpxI [Candidatus Cybelea sp.]